MYGDGFIGEGTGISVEDLVIEGIGKCIAANADEAGKANSDVAHILIAWQDLLSKEALICPQRHIYLSILGNKLTRVCFHPRSSGREYLSIIDIDRYQAH